SGVAIPETRQAIEIYIAGRHGARLREASFWSHPFLQGISSRLRPVAEDVASRHPSVGEEELARATTVIGPELQRRRERGESITNVSGLIIMATVVIGLVPGLLLSILSSTLVPGGVFTRLLGHAVITSNGREVGRTLSLARVLVAWAPAIAWLLYLAASPKVQGFVPAPPNPLLGAMLTVVAM